MNNFMQGRVQVAINGTGGNVHDAANFFVAETIFPHRLINRPAFWRQVGGKEKRVL